MLLSIFVISGCTLLVAIMAYVCIRQRRRVKELELRVGMQEKAVSDAQRQQELLFAFNPYPMYIHDRESLRFLDVNHAAVRSYGYSKDEFLRMTLLDIRPPEDVPEFLDVVNQRYSEYRRPGIRRHRRKDGSILLAEVAGYQYEEAGQSRELVVVSDVTERQRMQDALRESENTLKTLVDNAPFGIAQSSLADDRLTTLNPAMLEILSGYSYGEALQLKTREQIYADPKDRDRLIEVLRRGAKVIGWETNFKRRNGNLVPVRITGFLSGGTNGSPELVSKYVEDLTQQSSLEKQVRQVQKLEAVGRLAGGMAHDFNNVLVVIKLATEMMLGQITPDSPFSKPLLQISNAADRAAALTKQMLAFGRQQIMQPRIINLNAVVAETTHMLRRVIGEDVELITHLSPTVENSRLDPDQVTQVMLNLAVNARDAMPEGGTLHITTETVNLDDDYAKEHPPVQPGRYVMLAVSDSGTGIDRAILNRIFDPFFTTKEVGKGTGLGLAIVYGIVKQSGGYIWVYSEPGHGTSFKLYFPATTAAVDRSSARYESTGRASGQVVLVVDDEQSVRTNVSECLQQLGYRVLTAESSDAAWQACLEQQGKVDLVLTDLVMAGQDGHRLASDLADRYPGMTVLFMSGYTEDSASRRDILLKGSPFLQKPFSVAELANAVHNALVLKSALGSGEG
jgi:two-component system, cell cycle sensor histidine kinase and response regulator CckA